MQKTKLIKTLCQLNRNELQAFRHFVASPLFNKRAACLQLLDILLPHAPGFAGNKIEKHQVFSLLYPGDAFEYQRLKDESKRLFLLLRQFLAHQAIQQDPHHQEILALKELRKRNVIGVFEAQCRSLEKKLHVPGIKDEDTFFHLHHLHVESNHAFGLQELRVANNSLADAQDALDRYYLLKKLRGSAELLNRQRIVGTQTDISFTLHLIEYLANNEEAFQDTPAIKLYQLLLQLFVNQDNTAALEQLIKQLMTDVNRLPKEDAGAFFKYCQNFCVARINSGESAFLGKYFELYRFQIEQELLENLSHASYSNIIATGLRLGENEWVHRFMHEQLDKLNQAFREAVYHYNLAMYHHSLHDYHSALPLLQAIKFTDGFYAWSAKLLLCRIYFEMQEFDSLYYLIDAFQRHLNRVKELTPFHREPYRQFLHFLKRATNLYERKDILKPKEFLERQQKLISKINESQRMVHKSWLLGVLG